MHQCGSDDERAGRRGGVTAGGRLLSENVRRTARSRLILPVPLKSRARASINYCSFLENTVDRSGWMEEGERARASAPPRPLPAQGIVGASEGATESAHARAQTHGELDLLGEDALELADVSSGVARVALHDVEEGDLLQRERGGGGSARRGACLGGGVGQWMLTPPYDATRFAR